MMRRIIIGASRDIEYDLRNDFFAHLQRLDLAYFQRHRTGDLMSRATSDLSAVRMMIGPAIMYSATTGLMFIVGIILMVSINPRLTLFALVPLPFVSISVGYFGAVIHRRFERIQDQLSEISAITQETLSGVRVVRAYRQEPFEIERFRLANEEYVHRNRGLILVLGMYQPEHGVPDGDRGTPRPVARKPRSRGRPHDHRRTGCLQLLPDDAVVADDRVRLGDEPPAARDGVVEADARGVRHGARDHRCRGHRRDHRTGAVRVAASSFAT